MDYDASIITAMTNWTFDLALFRTSRCVVAVAAVDDVEKLGTDELGTIAARLETLQGVASKIMAVATKESIDFDEAFEDFHNFPILNVLKNEGTVLKLSTLPCGTLFPI